MVTFQIIAILSLVAYILYVTYYYAIPMFCFRMKTYFARKKHLCTDVRVIEEKVVVIFESSGKSRKIERNLGVPVDSRFWAMNLCSSLRSMLKEIQKWS